MAQWLSVSSRGQTLLRWGGGWGNFYVQEWVGFLCLAKKMGQIVSDFFLPSNPESVIADLSCRWKQE